MRLRLFIVLFMMSTNAHALGVLKYLKGYQLGLTYSTTGDNIVFNYDTDEQNPIPGKCADNIERSGKQTCSVSMNGAGSSGIGIMIEQTFKKPSGWFYFNYDLGFSFNYLEGEMNKSETTYQSDNSLPLSKAKFELVRLSVLPYIQLGVVTKTFVPDVILTLGPNLTTAVGNFTVNDTKEFIAAASTSGLTGFLSIEFVFFRFGDGYFSIFTKSEWSNKNGDATLSDDIDGMDNFSLSFNSREGGGFLGYGLKLILNWP